MAAPFTAASARQASAPGFRTVAAVALIGVALLTAVIALSVWSSRGTDEAPVVTTHYGAGYPLHGGLAGPSRISVFEQYIVSRVGYPLHGGLAGPSRVSTVEHSSYGAGYPLHGGLAGPSRVAVIDSGAGSFAPGYPLHGGLAGPSRVGEGD